MLKWNDLSHFRICELPLFERRKLKQTLNLFFNSGNHNRVEAKKETSECHDDGPQDYFI